MATETAERITDIESALDAMVSPDLTGEVEDTLETEEEATTEEDVEEHSEETEDDEETEESESDESEDESETEESEEDSEELSGDLHTVMVDGEEVQVDLDELKRGYSGQQYVHKGMKAAAEAKREAEQVYLQLQNERQQIAQVAEMIKAGHMVNPPQEPDKAMFESDPLGYMEARIAFDEKMEAYQAQNDALQQQLQKQTEAEQRSMEAYMKDQLTQLRAVEPDFNDPEKAQLARSAMTKAGEEVYGFTADEIGAITDHRHIRVLRDATRWQELQATKGAKREKATKNVAKRGKRKATKTSTGESRRRRQRERLKQSGSIDDAMALMMEGA